MPRTSPENLLGAIVSADPATMQRPAEHHKTSSAAQPAAQCFAVLYRLLVLNGLLAMASDASVASDASAVGVQVVRGLCACIR